MVGIQVDDKHFESLRESVSENAQALTDERTAHTTTRKQLSDYKHRVDEGRLALAVEQKEHDITRMQRDTLQTQCEDMQSEMETELKMINASIERVDICDKSCNTVKELKMKLSDEIEAKNRYKSHLRHDKNALNTITSMRNKITELEDSAERQAKFMEQVDTACKMAEERVIAQRAIIDKMKKDNDMYICPAANGCDITQCMHRESHNAHYGCGKGCPKHAPTCVKVNSCKECASMREEIINRDAVILQQESESDKLKEKLRELVDVSNDMSESIKKLDKIIKHRERIIMSSEFDTPELHQVFEPRADCVRPFAIMFSGKAGEMKKNAEKRTCKWYSVCTIAQNTAYACTENSGQHCGRKREIDSKHGVSL